MIDDFGQYIRSQNIKISPYDYGDNIIGNIFIFLWNIFIYISNFLLQYYRFTIPIILIIMLLGIITSIYQLKTNRHLKYWKNAYYEKRYQRDEAYKKISKLEQKLKYNNKGTNNNEIQAKYFKLAQQYEILQKQLTQNKEKSLDLEYDESPIVKGYSDFQQYCFKCHSKYNDRDSLYINFSKQNLENIKRKHMEPIINNEKKVHVIAKKGTPTVYYGMSIDTYKNLIQEANSILSSDYRSRNISIYLNSRNSKKFSHSPNTFYKNNYVLKQDYNDLLSKKVELENSYETLKQELIQQKHINNIQDRLIQRLQR